MKSCTITAVLLAFVSLLMGAAPPAATPGTLTGKPLISIEVSDLDGKPLDLKALVSGTLAVITFTTTWCGDCQALEALYREIMPQAAGIRFLSVYVGQPGTLVRRYLDKHPETAQAAVRLLDLKRTAATAMKVTQVPRIVMVDRNGRIQFDGPGLDKAALLRELDALEMDP